MEDCGIQLLQACTQAPSDGLGAILGKLIITCRNMKGVWEVNSVKHRTYTLKKLVLF